MPPMIPVSCQQLEVNHICVTSYIFLDHQKPLFIVVVYHHTCISIPPVVCGCMIYGIQEKKENGTAQHAALAVFMSCHWGSRALTRETKTLDLKILESVRQKPPGVGQGTVPVSPSILKDWGPGNRRHHCAARAHRWLIFACCWHFTVNLQLTEFEFKTCQLRVALMI